MLSGLPTCLRSMALPDLSLLSCVLILEGCAATQSKLLATSSMPTIASARGARAATAFDRSTLTWSSLASARDWPFVGHGWPVVCAVCGRRLMITVAGDQRGPAER